MNFSLRIAGIHYEELRKHLFPGDGREAVAFGLCGRLREENSEVLTVHKVLPLPHELCTREPDRITWPTEFLAPLLDEAKRKNLGVLKIHSHTSDYARFSSQDDESDRDTFAAIFNWIDTDDSHASAVMLPEGQIFGRSIGAHAWQPLDGITVVGDELLYWRPQPDGSGSAPFFERQKQLFGAGTSSRLRGLRVGIVGCSGTGSVVVELLARLGVGTLVLVDDDQIEDRNLNRIMNSKRSDVGRPKVEVLAEAVQTMGLGVEAIPLHLNLFTPQAVHAIAGCDVVFGCMDTVSGRHLLNRLATFYIVPYFDLGVHLAADGQGGIDEASGVIHYLQPGGSSLFSRQAYTMERVRAENLYRTDPVAFADQRAAGYIQGVDVDRPAVVSVNAFTASVAVNEFLARIHPFRSCSTRETGITRISFMEVFLGREEETRPCPVLRRYVGRGDMDPLLDWPSLSGNTP
jgi:hypothetical protein